MRRLERTTLVVLAAGLALTGAAGSAAARPVDAHPGPAWSGELVISEFRLRGPNGASDEFIEIYSRSVNPHTVTAASGTGYGIAASDGVTRCTIPNGTVIPLGGHYLCVNSAGYSLSSYPGGNGLTAAGDATYTTDIPDNAGIALFNNDSGGAAYSLANRLDAVGSTSETNPLYKEGAGYPALPPSSPGSTLYRDTCGKSGSMTVPGPCPGSEPWDSGDNAADFIVVGTTGVFSLGERLGAPGPENLSSPVQRNSAIAASLLDTCASAGSPPNRVRDLTSDLQNESTFGTLEIRRTFTNTLGGDITRLRFRVIDLTTYPASAGFADLRLRSSTSISVTVDRPPCGSGFSVVMVNGTTLEQPPAQAAGGGYNSSMSAGTITLTTPLASGASIDLRFLLGLQQTGNFKILLNIEALPNIEALLR